MRERTAFAHHLCSAEPRRLGSVFVCVCMPGAQPRRAAHPGWGGEEGPGYRLGMGPAEGTARLAGMVGLSPSPRRHSPIYAEGWGRPQPPRAPTHCDIPLGAQSCVYGRVVLVRGGPVDVVCVCAWFVFNTLKM